MRLLVRGAAAIRKPRGNGLAFNSNATKAAICGDKTLIDLVECFEVNPDGAGRGRVSYSILRVHRKSPARNCRRSFIGQHVEPHELLGHQLPRATQLGDLLCHQCAFAQAYTQIRRGSILVMSADVLARVPPAPPGISSIIQAARLNQILAKSDSDGCWLSSTRSSFYEWRTRVCTLGTSMPTREAAAVSLLKSGRR